MGDETAGWPPGRRGEPSFHDRHDACRPKTVPKRRDPCDRAVRERLASGGDRRTGPSAAAGGDVTGGASSVRHRPVTARDGESRFMLSYDGPLP